MTLFRHQHRRFPAPDDPNKIQRLPGWWQNKITKTARDPPHTPGESQKIIPKPPKSDPDGWIAGSLFGGSMPKPAPAVRGHPEPWHRRGLCSSRTLLRGPFLRSILATLPLGIWAGPVITLGCSIVLPVPGPGFRGRFWVGFGREPDVKASKTIWDRFLVRSH